MKLIIQFKRGSWRDDTDVLKDLMLRANNASRNDFPQLYGGSHNISKPFNVNLTDEHTERLSAVAIRAFRGKIRNVIADETNFDEECVRPSSRATRALIELVDRCFDAVALPPYVVYPDGKGGWRLEVRSAGADRYLLLAVHSTDASQDYIYFQIGDRRGEIMSSVSPNDVLTRMRWLIGTEK